jgi:uncharacterized membrane protein YdjX (TVP38/TMEM64 family)
MRKERVLGWSLIGGLVIILTWAIISYFNGGVIFSLINKDTTFLIDYLNSLGYISILFFLFLVLLENVFAPIPPLVLYFVGGVIFGPLLGGLLALAGNILGATIAFYLARKFARKYVERKFSKKIQNKSKEFSKKWGFLSVFLLRVNPITNTDLISYIAGLSRMRYIYFALATLLGLAPYLFIQTYFGDLIAQSTPLFNLVLFSGVIYAIFFVVLYIFFHKKSKKYQEKNSSEKEKIVVKNKM